MSSVRIGYPNTSAMRLHPVDYQVSTCSLTWRSVRINAFGKECYKARDYYLCHGPD